MRNFIYLFLVFFVLSYEAVAKVTVFACEPEWQNLAYIIAKDKIDITLGVSPTQNPKKIEIKPLIKRAGKARMFFCSGDGLEDDWLMRLASDSRNVKIIADPKKNILFAYDVIAVDETTQSLGPRVHLNPYNILKIADEFTSRIKELDPVNAEFYQASYTEFAEKWQAKIVEWEDKVQVLKGKNFIAYDDSWKHLENWLQIKIMVHNQDYKISQSKAVQLNEFAKKMRDYDIEAIIFASFEDKKDLLWLRDKLKKRMILLPFTVNGSANSSDLFKMFDATVDRLLTDCSSGICKSLAPAKEMTVKFK